MSLQKGFWILTISSFLLVIASIVLGFFNQDCGTAIGTISTIVSIALAIGSFLYSFISGEKTLKYLDEIKKENSSLVERLNFELAKENYGQKNIENIDKMIDNSENQ